MGLPLGLVGTAVGSTVGTREGDSVGIEDGATVGLLVGTDVGLAVGSAVVHAQSRPNDAHICHEFPLATHALQPGWQVGDPVGVALGLALGLPAVGLLLGAALGLNEGANVSPLRVGDRVGSDVGDVGLAVGALVGERDSRCVGAEVGACETSPSACFAAADEIVTSCTSCLLCAASSSSCFFNTMFVPMATSTSRSISPHRNLHRFPKIRIRFFWRTAVKPLASERCRDSSESLSEPDPSRFSLLESWRLRVSVCILNCKHGIASIVRIEYCSCSVR